MNTRFYDDPEEIEAALEACCEHQVVVYNAFFDIGVIRAKYPHIKLEPYCDVMRLRQLRERVEKHVGYGLKAAVKLHLPGMSNYEKKIHDWIRDNVPEAKKGKVGQYLDRAPRALLEEYNVADAVATVKLYEAFTKYFEEEGFDWRPDHMLYLGQCEHLIQACLEGIKVDQEHLKNFIAQVDTEVQTLDEKFNRKFAIEVQAVRQKLLDKANAKLKKKKRTELPPFNVSSKQHLEMLFVETLGITPEIKTPSGKPSFKAAHLSYYGDGGKMLENRGKRLITQGQAKGLLEQSQEDGRYHPMLKLVGTVTGRLAGSGGTNVQGVSRKEVGIMGAMCANPGWLVAEVDLVAGEPTLISHYSDDERYIYSNFTGKGKAPFIRDGFLYIDDVYLQFGWTSGLFTEEFRKAWDEGFDGESFASAWVRDPEFVKGKLKKYRRVFKWINLACGYALQHKKLMVQARTQDGIILSEEKAKSIIQSYWNLYPGIEALDKKMRRQFQRKGYVQTPFGFRAYPKAAHAAMNAYIQSQVSSIMAWLLCLVKEKVPGAILTSVVHDALLWHFPAELENDLRAATLESLKEINDTLQWTTKISTGFNVGERWSDLK